MSNRPAVRAVLAVVLAASALWTWPAQATGRSVPAPTLSEPPAGSHGHPMWDSWFDLRPFGYTEHEYFVSGTALSASGAAPAAYTTRIIVTRPASARVFNGTILLDWTNVTAQFENAVDSMETREMLLREGFAYVHVSAQKAGICCSPLTPQVYDPVRYAGLSHPGDDYANDMFSQIAVALKAHGRLDPMAGLKVRTVLAAGQSQSASKLYAYASTTQHEARVIDGFLIHGGGSKSYTKPLDVPVLHLLSDNEAKRDGPTKDALYRLWEVAGTAHSDFFIGYQSVFGLSGRLADQPAQSKAQYSATMDAAGNYGQVLHPMLATCVLAGSTVPMHYAASAALHQLNVWVRTGKAPKVTPRFTFAADGTRSVDADSNSLGGIRMPAVEVPVATYMSTSCPLGGLTVPFTDVQIQQRYAGFDAYQAKMKVATDNAVRQGWMLRPDAVDQMRRVCAARTRFTTGDQGTCKPYVPPAYASS